MKELIVIIGTIFLGLFIYKLMVVSGPNGSPSLLEASKNIFTSAIDQFK